MSTSLVPIDVALHWPFFRACLLLDRWPAADRALEELAIQQADNEGEPIAFGSSYWRGMGLTAGEAGRMRTVLNELATRGVLVKRTAEGGPVAHAWSFRPTVCRWRPMPWARPARDVERIVGSCSCRAPRVMSARLPGQGVARARGSGEFRLSVDFHLRRPGTLPVETRAHHTRRALRTFDRAWEPVETRAHDTGSARLHLSLKELTFLIEEDSKQRFAALLEKGEALCGQELYGDRLRARLARLAAGLSAPQVQALLRALDAFPDRLFAPKFVDVAEDLSTTPSVKHAGRELHPSRDPARLDLLGAAPPGPML
jgi:hypothetical protein